MNKRLQVIEKNKPIQILTIHLMSLRVGIPMNRNHLIE